MKQFYVYVHLRPDDTPFYVGKGHGQRAYQLRRYHNPHHQNIVAKYGAENIRVVVYACRSEKEAFQKEIALIREYQQLGVRLANMTAGGEGVANPSEEVREKLAAAMRGKVWSKEVRAKISKAHLGKVLSEATKSKMADSRKGRRHSKQHRDSLQKSISDPVVRSCISAGQKSWWNSAEGALEKEKRRSRRTP